METAPPLHDQDFYAWTRQQAVLLRARERGVGWSHSLWYRTIGGLTAKWPL
jgi:hypothetical protein